MLLFGLILDNAIAKYTLHSQEYSEQNHWNVFKCTNASSDHSVTIYQRTKAVYTNHSLSEKYIEL
jgi:hypothetical protein